jgi:hypothetical protein
MRHPLMSARCWITCVSVRFRRPRSAARSKGIVTLLERVSPLYLPLSSVFAECEPDAQPDQGPCSKASAAGAPTAGCAKAARRPNHRRVPPSNSHERRSPGTKARGTSICRLGEPRAVSTELRHERGEQQQQLGVQQIREDPLPTHPGK